jgi:hypothetical protein
LALGGQGSPAWEFGRASDDCILDSEREAIGEVYDYYMGRAANAAAVAWCKTHGLPVSARFAKSMYGDALAGTLSRAWCHKMQWHFSRAPDTGAGAGGCRSEPSGTYTEPEELTRAAEGLAGRQFARVQALRALVPARSSVAASSTGH